MQGLDWGVKEKEMVTVIPKCLNYVPIWRRCCQLTREVWQEGW